MTSIEIKIKMLERGVRVTDLARKWRTSKAIVSQLVHRKFKSAAMERKLARELGVKVSDLRGEQN